MPAKPKNPFILFTSVGTLLTLSLLGGRAQAQTAGVFSNSGALGAADLTGSVGLSTTKTYVEAIDLGDTVNTSVNGVLFTGSGAAVAPSGTGWGFTGTQSLFGGGGTLPGGVLGGLTNKFIYGGQPAVMTLTGLTVGQTYVITFYDRSWEGAGNRIQTITAGGASTATTSFDLDTGATAQGNLNLLRYTFQAGTATQTLSIAPQIGANTMHLYAFTNEQTFNNAWSSGADWSTAAWAVAQPNSVGASANFTAQGAPTSLNLDSTKTVGHIQFDGANAWTISGTNQLTLQTDVGGVSVLSALAGSHTISAPIFLGSDTVKFGSGTITLSGAVSGPRGLTLNAGSLILNGVNSYTGGTTLNTGTNLKLGADAALGVANGTLTVNTGGFLNLNGASPTVGTLTGTGGTIANDATGTNVVITLGSGNTGGGTYAGIIADHTTGTGTLALTKLGTATATLSGANSYTGLTSVSNGRLQLNGSAAAGTLATSAINIGTTGTFGFSAGVGSTLTMKAGSTLAIGGGTLAMDLGSVAGTDKIVADTFTITANSAIAFNAIAGPSVGTPYTLITYNTLNNSGGFVLNGTVAGRLTLNPVIGANSVTVTPTLDSATWNNPTGGPWSAGPWTNYTPTAAGDSAVFGPALLAPATVTLDTARTVGFLTFNNATASYTLGTAGSSNLTLNNGASSAIVFVTAGSHTIAENVALASDVSFSADAGTALTVKGVISGAKSLTKFGAGTLILTAANTYSTGTTITGGTLQLGDGTLNGSIAGNVTDNGNFAFNNAGAQTFTGIISGTGSVTKSSNGTLTLTGANTSTGGLTISAGTVDIGGNTTTGDFLGTIVNNSTLRYSRTGSVTFSATVNGTGNTIISGGISAAAGTTLAATASINTPTLTIGDAGTTQGWLNFTAPNQMNGTTGVLLTIAQHANNSRINLNGFSQTISGLLGTGIVQTGEAGTFPANTLTINVPTGQTYSWTGLIRNQSAGALSLTKTGPGEQTMNFSITNPTYSGATTVSQGRLIFGSQFAAPTWSTSGISVAAGAEVGLTGAGGGVISWSEAVVISGAGGLARTGVDTNTVTITNATNSFTGPARIGGTGILSIGSLANVGSNSALGAGTGTNDTTNAASLVLDGGTLLYTGAAVNTNRLFTLTQNGGTFDASGAGAVNFTNSGALATSGSGPRTLILTGTNTGNNTLSGALGNGAGGATSLTKNLAGTWVLRGANTYTGPTTINAGRLQLEGSAASTPQATSNLIVNPGTTLGFTAGTGSTLALGGTLTLAGGTTVFDLGGATSSDKITANTLALTANSALSFNQIGGYNIGTTYTLASYTTLSNPGSFTVSGFAAGRLTLNPVLGPTALTLVPQLDNATWNNTTGGTWDTGPWTGYTPNAAGDAALFGTKLAASDTIELAGPETVGYLTFDNAAASYTVGLFLSNNLTLANAGTASAQIIVNAGNHTLQEDSTLSSDVSILTAASTSLTIIGALNGPGKSVTKNGAGTLTLGGLNNFGTVAGTGLTINQGKVILANPSALATTTGVTLSGGVLDLNANDTTLGSLAGTGGTITDNGTTAGATNFTIFQNGNSTFGGTLADGSARTLTVVKNGIGSLTLAGANTFSGNFTITGGSVTAASGFGVAIPGNITLGTGTGGSVWLISGAPNQQYGPTTGITFTNAGSDAKFELRGTNQTLAGVDSTTGQSLSIIQNDELTAPGYTAAPGPATLTLNTATNHSFYGIIREQVGGGLSIVKNGPGTQEFINNPTIGSFNYIGTTTINGGELILNLSGATSAGYASDVTVNAPATLGLDGTWTLGRAVAGSGNLIKHGSGTVTISSALTFTGTTTIAAGTLVLTGSLSGTSSLEIQSGATLDVSGLPSAALGATQTLSGKGTLTGAATINGTFAPGPGLGTLTTGPITFAGNSVFSLQIDTSSVTGLTGSSDVDAVTGALTLATGVAPKLSVSDVGGNLTVAQGTQFTFITYTGAWNGGLFSVGGNPIPDDATFLLGANRFKLDYNAGGNSVALIAVPEPTTALSLLGGVGCLVAVRRRRRA